MMIKYFNAKADILRERTVNADIVKSLGVVPINIDLIYVLYIKCVGYVCKAQ